MRALTQLLHFGYQQALACVFPVVIFGALAFTQVVTLPFLPRYDWLLLFCIAMQVILVYSGRETKDELKVIMMFHIIGLTLEIFKVHMGSWAYPEEAYTKVLGVPLFSGFMYASVASYLCQAWRRLGVQLIDWPPLYMVVTLAILIYSNFFTHHFWWDARWILIGAVLLIFLKSVVFYEVNGTRYNMPVPLAFALIGFFIWIAENIATYFGAWQYPNQVDAWSLVHLGKVSSWFLLVIVSFFIVAALKQVKEEEVCTGGFYFMMKKSKPM